MVASPKTKAPNLGAAEFYEPQAIKPGIAGRITGAFTTAIDVVAGLPVITLPVGLLAGGIGLLGSGIGWVHKGAGSRVQRAGETVGRVNRVFDVTSSDLTGRFPKIGNAVGSAAQWSANRMASPLEAVVKSTGYGDWQVGRHGRAIEIHLPKAYEAAQGISKGELAEALKELRKSNPRMANHFEAMHMSIMRAGKNGGELHKSFTAASAGVKQGIIAGQSWTSNAKVDAFYEAAQKVAHHQGRIEVYSDVAKSIRNAPKVWSKRAIGHNISNAAAVGASAIGMFGTTKDFTGNITALKHMYTDLTGKSASSFKVLVGNVPAPVAEARSQLFKQFGLESGLQTVGLLLGIKQFRGGRISGKLMAGQIAMFMASRPIGEMIGTSVLPIYEAFHKAHASGKKIPPDYYLEFIGTASPMLRNKGGTDNPFTQELAKQYFEEQAGPKKIMNDIANGELVKRMEKIAARNDAEAKTQTPSEAVVKESQAPMQASMVDKLRTDPLKAVGKHTAAAIAAMNNSARIR